VKFKVTLVIERADHPALRYPQILLAINAKRGNTGKQDPKPSSVPGEITWEFDADLDPPAGQLTDDNIEFAVAFNHRADPKSPSLFSVFQGLWYDPKGQTLVPSPKPEEANHWKNPLIDVNKVQNAVRNEVRVTVHTRIVDLTDVALEFEKVGPNPPGKALWSRKKVSFLQDSQVDNEGCDVRLLGLLQDEKDPDITSKCLTPIWVVLPPGAPLKSRPDGTKEVGVFTFHGPARTKPDFTADPIAFWPYLDFMDGSCRYLNIPAHVTDDGTTFGGEKIANKKDRLAFFGWTEDEADTKDRQIVPPPGGKTGLVPVSNPNCSMMAMLARAARPMILVLTWSGPGWSAITEEMASSIRLFLWATYAPWMGEPNIQLGRMGMGGFSEGGQAAMTFLSLSHPSKLFDRLSEVYLFDPMLAPETATAWFLGKPEVRRLRLISGNQNSSEDSSWALLSRGIWPLVKGQAQGVKKDKDGTVLTGPDKKPIVVQQASFLPTDMLAGKNYGLDYYDVNQASCSPTWWIAYRYYRLRFPIQDTGVVWHQASTTWRAHQWTVMGGEIGGGPNHDQIFDMSQPQQPLAADYRTFFGQCLDLSDF
jgi:hypothetical protein